MFPGAPEKFPYPGSRSSISNLMITELFYLHILNMARSSLHTRSFRRIHLSVFRYRLTKNDFADPKSFRDFRETGPRLLNFGHFLSHFLSSHFGQISDNTFGYFAETLLSKFMHTKHELD